MTALLLTWLMATTAHAMPILGISTGSLGEPGVTQELEIAAASNERELRIVVDRMRSDLDARRAVNPGLRPEVVLVSASSEKDDKAGAMRPAARAAGEVAQDNAKVERAELTDEAARSLQDAFKDWFLKNYRVTFTVIRGISNSTTVAWGLIISGDIPPGAAISVGLVAGGLAAGLQYCNGRFQNWLLGNGGTFGKWLRMAGVNAGYLSVMKAASALSGIPTEPTILLSLGSIVKTALLATVAQSPWGLAIAEQERLALRRLPRNATRARVMADIKVLGISMLGAGVAIAELVGIPLARVAMYGLAAGGLTTYGWTIYKAKRQKSRCEELLSGVLQRYWIMNC